MLLRSICLLLGLAGTLSLASCVLDGGDDPPPPPAISVAVGAEVTLVLDEHNCTETLVSGCLSQRPAQLGGVYLTPPGPFELGESVLDNGTLRVTVRALSAGDSVLVVDHQDFAERSYHDEIRLRAAAITHVAPRVSCSSELVAPSYPVTAGSELTVELTAMAGSTPLASGELELVDDAAGFELLDGPGGPRRIRAPLTPGHHVWDLRGADGLDFDVYEPGDLELRLSEDDGGVRVERVLGGVPVCLHEGSVDATIAITKGGCLPLVKGFEIEGPLAVDMGAGDFTLALSGKDTCEIAASIEGGKAASLTLPVDNLPEPPEPGPGEPLGATPIALDGVPEERDSCPLITNLGDGICDVVDDDGYIILDAECLLDWSWSKELYSIDGYVETLVESKKVGKGLWVELHLGIVYKFLGVGVGTYSTNHLTYSSTPAAGIEIEDAGCIGHDRQVLVLRPSASGSFTLALDADNVYQPTTFGMTVGTIADARYATDAVDVKTIAGGTEEWWFVGAQTPFQVSYTNAAGEALVGAAPLLLSSDGVGADASYFGRNLATGSKPTVLRLQSEAKPADAHLMHVVDANAITAVGGMTGATLNIGEGACLDAFATAPGGARIHGPSPVRPRLTLAGAKRVIDVQNLAPKGVCFHTREAGTIDASVVWGDASGQAGFTVQ